MLTVDYSIIVTIQQLHSYEQKSIADCLHQWNFGTICAKTPCRIVTAE